MKRLVPWPYNVIVGWIFILVVCGIVWLADKI